MLIGKSRAWLPKVLLVGLLLLGLTSALWLVIVSSALTGSALAQQPGEQPEAEAEFGYEGAIGPSNWARLSPEYGTCATGVEQSPVDIPATAPTNEAGLDPSYRPTELAVTNTGHSLQTDYEPGSFLEAEGSSYELQQFHFHNPSEHTVDGNATPLELHLVHENSQGEAAVVSVLLVEGETNEALAPVFENLPAEEGEAPVPGASVDAAGFLPQQTSYWRYDGSLTTPPCTEGVKWFVMTEPVEVSSEQIAAHNAIYSGNARPTQPLNAREFLAAQDELTMPATGGPPITAAVAVVGGALLVGSGVLVAIGLRRGRSS